MCPHDLLGIKSHVNFPRKFSTVRSLLGYLHPPKNFFYHHIYVRLRDAGGNTGQGKKWRPERGSISETDMSLSMEYIRKERFKRPRYTSRAWFVASIAPFATTTNSLISAKNANAEKSNATEKLPAFIAIVTTPSVYILLRRRHLFKLNRRGKLYSFEKIVSF